jgi:hypothetical protein
MSFVVTDTVRVAARRRDYIIPLGSLSHQGGCDKQDTVLLIWKSNHIAKGECGNTIPIEW